MNGCLRCWNQAELDQLDGDPALVPDDLLRKFAREVYDHFDQDEYELAWRRFAPRIVGMLDHTPESWLTQGLTWAGVSRWPENEQIALRSLLTETVVRAAGNEERRLEVAELIWAAAQMDQDVSPWLRVVDGLPPAVVAELARDWSYDLLAGSGRSAASWDLWPEPGDPIREWLLTASLRARLSEVDGESAQWAVYQIDMLADVSTR
ncbi:hypothetical protein ACSHWB_08515 [Lentzea sp. HUAS TT2]|uniref:hypothetical protein n=1 Tax=Lentzea sp. HUAS TT2 TaxID=3447454 RepID=UPI003F71F9EC